jgi:hypothetical protein
MTLWTWWKAQWPREPAHLFVSAVAAGAVLMAGLFRSSTDGWDLMTCGYLVAAGATGLVALAVEANCRKWLQEALKDRDGPQQE